MLSRGARPHPASAFACQQTLMSHLKKNDENCFGYIAL